MKVGIDIDLELTRVNFALCVLSGPPDSVRWSISGSFGLSLLFDILIQIAMQVERDQLVLRSFTFGRILGNVQNLGAQDMFLLVRGALIDQRQILVVSELADLALLLIQVVQSIFASEVLRQLDFVSQILR